VAGRCKAGEQGHTGLVSVRRKDLACGFTAIVRRQRAASRGEWFIVIEIRQPADHAGAIAKLFSMARLDRFLHAKRVFLSISCHLVDGPA
jgi:hypothetical protein